MPGEACHVCLSRQRPDCDGMQLFLSPKLKRRLTNDARRLALDDARDSAYMYAQVNLTSSLMSRLTCIWDYGLAYTCQYGWRKWLACAVAWKDKSEQER